MSQMLGSLKCSAKTFSRPRKSFVINGPAFQTVEDGLGVALNAKAPPVMAML